MAVAGGMQWAAYVELRDGAIVIVDKWMYIQEAATYRGKMEQIDAALRDGAQLRLTQMRLNEYRTWFAAQGERAA